MNKTKFVLTVFAVLASFLMIMSTTMARPVQEKKSMNALTKLNGLTKNTKLEKLEEILIKIRDNNSGTLGIIEGLLFIIFLIWGFMCAVLDLFCYLAANGLIRGILRLIFGV